MIVEAVDPVLQRKVYGAQPPVPTAVAVPSLPPKQVTSVLVTITPTVAEADNGMSENKQRRRRMLVVVGIKAVNVCPMGKRF